jgi:hypothetical protein
MNNCFLQVRNADPYSAGRALLVFKTIVFRKILMHKKEDMNIFWLGALHGEKVGDLGRPTFTVRRGEMRKLWRSRHMAEVGGKGYIWNFDGESFWGMST